MTKQQSHREDTRFPWFDAPQIDVITQAGDAYGKACLAWQQEVFRFVAGRLQADGEFGQRLMGCQNWNEAAAVQQKWATSATEDFLNEANKLVQLASDFGANLMPAASQGAAHGAQKAKVPETTKP